MENLLIKKQYCGKNHTCQWKYNLLFPPNLEKFTSCRVSIIIWADPTQLTRSRGNSQSHDGHCHFSYLPQEERSAHYSLAQRRPRFKKITERKMARLTTLLVFTAVLALGKKRCEKARSGIFKLCGLDINCQHSCFSAKLIKLFVWQCAYSFK